jgi:hypothetical protein
VLNSFAEIIFLMIGIKGWWNRYQANRAFVTQRWFPLITLGGMVSLSFIAAC